MRIVDSCGFIESSFPPCLRRELFRLGHQLGGEIYSMAIRQIIISTFCAFLLVLVVNGQDNTSSRDPFILELPGVSQDRFTLPIVRLPSVDLRTLKVRVLNPFAETIEYGDIILTLNGDGINRGCSKTRDLQGKVVVCGHRDDRFGGFVVDSAKNILEIRAVDKKGREYYASYVLILGDKSANPTSPVWKNGVAEQDA